MPQTEKSPSPHNRGKGHRGLLHKTGNITWTELMFRGRDKHEFFPCSHLQRVFIFQQHALYPWCADKGSTTDFPIKKKIINFTALKTQQPNLQIMIKYIIITVACNADHGSIPGSGRPPGEGIGCPLQYSWAFLVAQMVKSLPAMWEIWVQSLCWEDALEESMATCSSSLAWRIPMDRGAWWVIVHRAAKSRTRLST